MLHIGTNIAAFDILQPLSEEQLLQRIMEPETVARNFAEQLKTIGAVDRKRYAELKRKLTYFVCATFNPPVRKTENFASIDYCVVDIDHLAEQGIKVRELKEKMLADNRVRMCFVSPSGDGLKLLFQLKDKCYDAGLFSAFYKAFAAHFAHQYQLEQVIDARTSDAARACFIPYDPLAHYNPLSDTIDLNEYVNMMTFSPHQRSEKPETPSETPQPGIAHPDNAADPDADTMNRIKQLLGQARKKQTKDEVYVPAQLHEAIEGLRAFLQEVEVCVDEIIDIQYGKKIRAHMGRKLVECNLFFGKKGFSVVASPKRGTDMERNSVLKELITLYFQQNG